MKILQFRCENDDIANGIIGIFLRQWNEWSRLRWLTDDPEYLTDPFGLEVWHRKVSDPAVRWADWSKIYPNITDSGRIIADQVFGSGVDQGQWIRAPLRSDFPDMFLELVDVDDLVAAGYQCEQ